MGRPYGGAEGRSDRGRRRRKAVSTDEDSTCGREKWGWPQEVANALSKVRLPTGTGGIRSGRCGATAALEGGITVEEAIRAIPAYAETRNAAEPLPMLPPVRDLKAMLGEIATRQFYARLRSCAKR